MPSTVNGIGTWYRGKSNFHRVMGTCEACGAFGELSSYDTTLYFVVFFIPVIPLGGKRVIRECPGCGRHRAAPLREWEAAKRTAAERAAADLRDSADFPSAFRRAVGDFVAFEDGDAFLALAGGARERIAGDAKALAALGAGYACFGRDAEAESAYRASLTVTDDPDVRETLAGHLVTRGRPDEAAPFLAHVIAEKQEGKVGDLYLLAMGYQAKGMHREALTLLDGIARAFPGVASEADFRRLKGLSTKHEATGKPVRSPLVATARTDGRKGAVSPRLWAAVGPGILLVALAAYLLAAWSGGRSRKVWLVNGLRRSYQVSVAGRTWSAPPLAPLEIRVPEGEIAVRVLDAGLGIPEETCRIETPFLTRPFLDRTYVINPDRVGIVLRERAVYAATPGSEDIPPVACVGRVLYEFRDVDYEFREFPEKLRTESSRLVKTRVEQLRSAPGDAILALGELVDEASLQEYLKRNAACDPNEVFWLYALVERLEPARFIEFLKPRLAERPVLVDWHRMYQTVTERTEPARDLEAEYRPLLEAAPDDPALAYLAGRVARDREESLSLFRRAAEAGKPCAHAAYALAFSCLGQGRFDEALDLATRADRALPGRLDFTYVRETALLAAERVDELIERTRRKRRAAPFDAALACAETRLLAAAGDDAGAREVARAYSTRLMAAGEREAASTWGALLDAVRSYASGDVDGYLKGMALVGAETPAFEFHLTAGRIDEAAKAAPRADAVAHLLVYVAAAGAGRDDLAKEHLGAAVEALRAGGRDDREAARLLSGDRPPGESEAVDLGLGVGLKRVVLTALGVRFPEARERYYPLARRLNFDPSFPWLFLKKALGRPPQPTSM